MPLVIGAAIRHYAETVATKIFPAVRVLAKLSTLLMIVACFVIYGRAMLDTAGSFALLSMTIFMVAKGLITYRFGFGLKQNQRSVMSLGMLTPNGPGLFVAVLTIPDAGPAGPDNGRHVDLYGRLQSRPLQPEYWPEKPLKEIQKGRHIV